MTRDRLAVHGARPVSPVARKMAIEERIEEALEVDSGRLFWADSFVAEGFGTTDEVLEALHALIAEGRLTYELEVHSSSGHRCWRGPSGLYQAIRLPFECPECGHIFETKANVEEYLSVHFEISDAWEAKLSRSRRRKER